MIDLREGDCLDVLSGLATDSLDSCICDPPYHLTSIVKRFGAAGAQPAKSNGATGVYARASAGFMGQQWDGGDVAFRPETWAEVLRVLKPGAHLLAFGGTRTYHRMVCAIEDAGFEVRDQIGWAFGSGFPKSHNLDGDWQGWGTALKPAWEPIVVARKPLVGTVAANVLAHGTGALNIDGCRIHGPEYRGEMKPGRWPANLVHDGSDEVLACFPQAPGQIANASSSSEGRKKQNVYGPMKRGNGEASAARRYTDKGGTNFAALPGARRGDSGSAARFFYCAKTSKAERGEGNDHPTVKPIALMRWLVRLVTPPGGTVLDPFAGSGSTGLAADAEGFDALLIEKEPKYAAIARQRLGLVVDIFA